MDYTDLYNFNTSTGVIIPNTAEVKSGIEEKFRSIFGSDLDVREETLVGRLIETFSRFIRSAVGVTAQNANQFNYATATGIYLDSFARIFNLEREPATKTIIPITVRTTGRDVIVPSGSLIASNDGDIFIVDSDIIPSSEDGEGYWRGNGTATASEFGPIPGDERTVETIQSAVLGWIGVTNGNALSIGSLLESDEHFRKRIEYSRPEGVGYKTHLISLLSRIQGVRSACVYENNNIVPKVEGGVVVPGHSIYVCVDCASGEDIKQEVAEAIVKVKPAGTGMTKEDGYGEKFTVSTFNSLDKSNRTEITFYKATPVTISLKVDADDRFYMGHDAEGEIKNSIIKYISDLGAGSVIFGTSVAKAVMNDNTTISITSVKVGLGGYDDLDMLEMYGYQKPLTSVDDIKIVFA